jgi:hypothetical protein
MGRLEVLPNITPVSEWLSRICESFLKTEYLNFHTGTLPEEREVPEGPRNISEKLIREPWFQD